MKSNNKSIKQRAAKVAEMPQDVIMGTPVLCVTGNTEINVENYGGIIEYTDHLIRIRTKKGQITIKGNGLHIEYYANDEMKISGRVFSIEFKY